MPPLAGVGYWHSLLARHAKALKAAYKEAAKAIEAKVAGQAELQPVLARNTPRQPLHPAARLRQNQSRWYSSTAREFNASVRRFTSSARQQESRAIKYDRSSFPKSSIGNAVNRSSGRAPFASTLRPNLTGGAIGRTAGGYSLGSGRIGGARYFSHGPASQAQVVQNVSQAVRVFFLSGQKAQFNGTNPISGEKKYKAVTALQEESGRKMRSLPKATPGSYIDFTINPTITALTPLKSVAGYSMSSTSTEGDHLNTDGLLDILSVDFSRALKELAAVLNDLKKVSALGDLPITYQGSSLRVHFPGCDSDTVERLCDELNVQRGLVFQDEDFDAFTGTEMALLFPFAPSKPASEAAELFESSGNIRKSEPIDWHNMLSPTQEAYAYSTQSDEGLDEVVGENPWLSDPSGYESLGYNSSNESKSQPHSPLEYQGFEGIYRFIEQCDSARR